MKNTTRRPIVLSAVLLLCAVGVSAQGGVEERCLRLVLSSVESPLLEPSDGGNDLLGKEGVFSARRTTDLIFNVLFPTTLTGEGVLTLRVSTPRGHHYRQLDVPYSLSPGGGQHRDAAGDRLPVPDAGGDAEQCRARSGELQRDPGGLPGGRHVDRIELAIRQVDRRRRGEWGPRAVHRGQGLWDHRVTRGAGEQNIRGAGRLLRKGRVDEGHPSWTDWRGGTWTVRRW